MPRSRRLRIATPWSRRLCDDLRDLISGRLITSTWAAKKRPRQGLFVTCPALAEVETRTEAALINPPSERTSHVYIRTRISTHALPGGATRRQAHRSRARSL